MKNIWLTILFFSAYTLQAQTDLPTGKIEVIKDYEVRLIETKKIKIVPQPVPVDSNVRRYEYKLLTPSPAIAYVKPEIKPLAINAEKKPVYYPLYAKVGYGSPNSFVGMASYDHIQSENLQWGIDLSHLSANNKKIPLQKFSDTRARINGTYLLNEQVQIDGYIDGHAEKVYFYGADPIPDNPEALKRIFNRYDAYFQIAKAYAPESSFTYKGFLQYLTDKDDLGSRETGFRVGGDLRKGIGADEYPLGIKVLADLSKLVHTETHAVNNLLIEPFFEYAFGSFKIHLGGKALLNKQQNEILPDIDISFPLFNNGMTIFAGWTGEVVKNNFRFLSTYNPYIGTRLDSLNNNTNRRIYAGVKGASGSFAYDVTGEYTSFEGMAFFLQDEEEPQEFLPVYDDGSFIGISASLKFEVLKHVILYGQLSQRFFSPDHEAKPWHRPSTGLRGQLSYAGGEDKFHVSFLFNAENGLPYITVGGTEAILDPLIDLSLQGDYFFTESLGAFVEVNNILGNKRERWATYPTFGFNAKAGILFRLP